MTKRNRASYVTPHAEVSTGDLARMIVGDHLALTNVEVLVEGVVPDNYVGRPLALEGAKVTITGTLAEDRHLNIRDAAGGGA